MTGFNGTPSKRILDAFAVERDATGALVPKPKHHELRHEDLPPGVEIYEPKALAPIVEHSFSIAEIVKFFRLRPDEIGSV